MGLIDRTWCNHIKQASSQYGPMTGKVLHLNLKGNLASLLTPSWGQGKSILLPLTLHHCNYILYSLTTQLQWPFFSHLPLISGHFFYSCWPQSFQHCKEQGTGYLLKHLGGHDVNYDGTAAPGLWLDWSPTVNPNYLPLGSLGANTYCARKCLKSKSYFQSILTIPCQSLQFKQMPMRAFLFKGLSGLSDDVMHPISFPVVAMSATATMNGTHTV